MISKQLFAPASSFYDRDVGAKPRHSHTSVRARGNEIKFVYFVNSLYSI